MFTTTLRRLPIWEVQAITLGTFVVWYLETWIWHFAQLHPVLVVGIWQHLCSWASIVLPCSSGCKPKSLQQPRCCQSARYGWKGLDHRWFWLCKACPILQEMCQITSSALDKKQLRFAVGDVSVSLGFCSVVVFMGTRIMSPDMLMKAIISTWTSSPCSDAFPQFFRRSSTKPWTPTAWPYSISVFLALIFWDIWMRLIGKQQFDISTPFSRRLMSTVAFMVILRPGNKQQKRQKQRDCFCFFLWLLGFWAILFDEEQT